MTKFPSLGTSQFSDNPIRISDVSRVVRKYGVYILGSTILGAILAATWAHFQPSLYDATSMIHLDQHSSISIGPAGASTDEYALKLQTQIVGLRNPDVAIATMKKLKLPQNPIFNPSLQQDLVSPASRDRLVAMFLGSLKIARVPQTELISVTFRSKNPVLSAIVVNTLVDEYFEESFEQRYRSTQDISRYLTTRLETLQSKIQGEQNELMTSGLKLGIIDIGSGSNATSGTSSIGTSTLVVETSGLLDQRVKAQADLYLAQAEFQNLQEHPDAVPPADVPGSLEMGTLIASLSTAKGQLASLEQRYGSNYPGLGQVNAEVSSYEHDIAELHSKLVQSAKQNVDRAQSVVDSLNNRIEALKQQSEGSTPEIVHYEVLKSQYMSDQTLYNVLLSTLGTGEIQAGMQTQVLNRFVTADVPGSRAYPRVGLTGMVGGFGGMVLSFMIVGIVVFSSDTVETIEQIEEALPVPILASVPEYKDELTSRASAGEGISLITLLAPRSASAEAYRLLRTSISLMPISQKHRVIALTSGGPGEGKSTSALNLAVVLATQSKRVLLIDADLRKPTIAQRLKMNATDQPGLSRYLSDSSVTPEDCVQRVTEIPGIDVMPVQEIPPFPSELLSQGRLEGLLAWARDHYDYVLIDTPPILLVTDALIIANHCDTLLVVARIGVAQKRGLFRIRQDLAKYPSKQTGIIVNALPFSDTYYRGYGNYRKYYGTGYGGESGDYYSSGYLSSAKKKKTQ